MRVSIRPAEQSVRPSPIFLALVAVTVVGGVLAWRAGASVHQPLAYAGVFVLVIGGWIVSLCLHEFGHAFTAWRFGDHDAAMRGYLSLNPFKYSNPMLSMVLPLLFIAMGGIGLPGGAVWVRTGAMTKRQRTAVSLAGPFTNLVLAVLLLGAARILYPQLDGHLVFWSGVAFLGLLQVMAVVLNIIPIPPLDGYGALEPHLSPGLQRSLDPIKQYGFFILLFILIAPPLNGWFFALVYNVYEALGGDGPLAAQGYDLTLFWHR
jgi:Zn-dependent protease